MLEKKLKIAPLESLELSTASYNHLKRAGFLTVYDVFLAIEENRLVGIRNIGVKLGEEVTHAVHSYIDSIGGGHWKDTRKVENIKNKIDISLLNESPITKLAEFLGKDRCDRLAKAGILTVGDLHDLVAAYQKFERSDDKVTSLAIENLQDQANELIKQGKLNPFMEMDGKKVYSIINTVPVNDEERLEKFGLLREMIGNQKK